MDEHYAAMSEVVEAAPPAAEPTTAASDSFTCPSCGDTALIRKGGQPPIEPLSEVLRCTMCETRIAYGVPMPKVVVTPHPEDARFRQLVVTSTHKDQKGASVTLTFDRDYFAEIAHNMASIP
jgi:hypothetical protein